MSNKKDFQIGKIVYVLSDKTNTVIPGIVIEKVLIESLNGSSTSWKIKFGSEKNHKIVDTLSFNQEIYLSLDEIAAVLRSNFNEFINELIQSTNSKTKEWYGKTTTGAVVQQKFENTDSLEDFIDEQPRQVERQQQQPKVQSNNMRDRLKQAVTPSDDEMMEG